jgi:transketolase
MSENKKRDDIIVNAIRALSMDAVQAANSGHPGAPMGLAPAAYTLYGSVMKYNPADPQWFNRDRFVLSAGHASMLLYSILNFTGFDLELDEIKKFRQYGSKCAGHPEYGMIPGIETTTGPLGQGAATSVGMAIAEKWYGARYNKPGYNLVDYKTYAILGDGCMMEGITSEAASTAGHLKLGNLVWLYDSNRISIEGSTDLTFTENVEARFKAYGWKVITVDDMNNLEALKKAYAQASEEKTCPVLIIVSSHIAYGSPNMQDSAGSHGAPLGEEEIKLTKKFYGMDPEKKFFVPEEVESFKADCLAKGKILQADWEKLFAGYKAEFAKEAEELELIMSGKMPEAVKTAFEFSLDYNSGVATRASGGKVINATAEALPWFVGGSADLGPSNKTVIGNSDFIQADSFSANNIHFGVREHAMGSIANGLALSGLKSFCGTFLVFSDYMKSSIRLSALMNLPVSYIFTHDSIGVGEDGPTHQPVEHLAALRTIPNLHVIRPADHNEAVALWRRNLLDGQPAAFILSRQNLPVIDREVYEPADDAEKGAYVLCDCDGGKQADVILIGTGSEVDLCLQAAKLLKKEGKTVRVVSMPCREIFEKTDIGYQNAVLPKNNPRRVVVEAGCEYGWHRYSWDDEAIVCVRTFGESAPASKVYEHFGITPENIAATANKIISKHSK